jgi:hypothetical protein
MADFCNQCTDNRSGDCVGDFVNLSTAADTEAGLFPVVLCEGCGAIQVDHLGNCISHDHHPDGTHTERTSPAISSRGRCRDVG